MSGRLRLPGTVRTPTSSPAAATTVPDAGPARPGATRPAATTAAPAGVTLDIGPLLDLRVKPRSKLEVAVDRPVIA